MHGGDSVDGLAACASKRRAGERRRFCALLQAFDGSVILEKLEMPDPAGFFGAEEVGRRRIGLALIRKRRLRAAPPDWLLFFLEPSPARFGSSNHMAGPRSDEARRNSRPERCGTIA